MNKNTFSLHNLKISTKRFFNKIKYISAFFFLFLLLICFFFPSFLPFKPFLWIFLVGFLFSVVSIIILRVKTRIVLKKTGLEVRSSEYHVLIPWLYIDTPLVCISEGHFLFVGLKKVTPGQSFHVKKYHFSTEGKSDSDWIQTTTDGIKFFLKETLNIVELRERISNYLKKTPSPLDVRLEKISQKSALHLGKTSKKHQAVALYKDCNINFPSFCPITGEEVSTSLVIDTFEFLVSSKGYKLYKNAHKYKRYLNYAACFLSVLLGLVVSRFGLAAFSASFAPLAVSYMGLWIYLRDKITVIESAESYAVIHFDDSDYSDALIHLNYSVSS